VEGVAKGRSGLVALVGRHHSGSASSLGPNQFALVPRFVSNDALAGGRTTTTTQSDRAAKDLGAVFDAHVKAEFVNMDVAATMATMAPENYLTHVPNLTGGTGRAQVERFYRYHFVAHWPDDVQMKPLWRTVGPNRVIDELVVSFTHDREMRVYLPGVAPTGRKVCCRTS
jgi:hypothetical protein